MIAMDKSKANQSRGLTYPLLNIIPVVIFWPTPWGSYRQPNLHGLGYFSLFFSFSTYFTLISTRRFFAQAAALFSRLKGSLSP